MPLFPYAVEGMTVRLECANRHHATAPLPEDGAARRRIDAWIARRGAQMHAQHERWGTDEKEQEDEDGD